jgi:hypothetical protein
MNHALLSRDGSRENLLREEVARLSNENKELVKLADLLNKEL